MFLAKVSDPLNLQSDFIVSRAPDPLYDLIVIGDLKTLVPVFGGDFLLVIGIEGFEPPTNIV